MNQKEIWGWPQQVTTAAQTEAQTEIPITGQTGVSWSATALDQLAETLRRDGICVIPNLFPQAVIARWKAAFDQLFQQRQSQSGGLAPREQARYYLTLPWTEPFADRDIFANPVILA
ncbi:MAG: hypothetical protein ACKO7W_12125, partial [Elainella sp.]